MWNRLLAKVERRRFRRLEASIEVAISVELYGFEGAANPFFSSGVTLDMSRGGVLARLDAPIHAGAVCNVFFRDCGDQVRPCYVAGRVIRCEEIDGAFRIAVTFEEPLLALPGDTETVADQPVEALLAG